MNETATPKPLARDPVTEFNSWEYIRHNQRRQEHLASLGLDLSGKTVLEVGAGIGDHTTFFIDRGCSVVTTDGRPENLEVLKRRFPNLESHFLDMEQPQLNFGRKFDIVYCYGLLYHLKDPVPAINYMANHCAGLLLLETCVSYGNEPLLNPIDEPSEYASQAVSGKACRPTRVWVYQELKKYFRHVYLPLTQPNHEEFPIEWTSNSNAASLTRSIFIGAHAPLIHTLLTEEIPQQQCRQ